MTASKLPRWLMRVVIMKTNFTIDAHEKARKTNFPKKAVSLDQRPHKLYENHMLIMLGKIFGFRIWLNITRFSVRGTKTDNLGVLLWRSKSNLTRPIAVSRVLRAIGFRPTNRPTDQAAYRIACTQLTSSYTRNKSFAGSPLPADKSITDGPTDGPTDRRTNGRTHPLIESWLTTKNSSKTW